ncbi:FkbM family methyltransferase [Asticcacaulis sp. 201]|uniref:FkbM family methyltransferase n=1 Tax=Asticcacaulis sp. 201 TaxID=3028787 RepID=UPI002916DC18|nr:FkbM family methyltransferase [Asticcacaulis sp. 201]MDV6331035.1 FkbM family methyltransferase [Asticcacaulis sp. 201]
MLISYAQNFEDVLLWRALKTVSDGFYIDVGAQDPVIDSVTKLFYDKGWRGVHVEPTPDYARQLRAARTGDVVLEAAASNQRGQLIFYEIPGTGISTGDAEIAEKHRQSGFEVREISVQAVTLADVFEMARGQDIHWMKVDIEGMEWQALRGWGASNALPWIVVVESTLPLTTIEAHFEWEPLLLQRGYVFVYFDGLNRYYVSPEKKDLARYFTYGASLTDDFCLSGLASAPFCRHVLEQGLVNVGELNEQLQAANETVVREKGAREASERQHVAVQRSKDQLHTAKLSAIASELIEVQREAREREGSLRTKIESLTTELLETQKRSVERENAAADREQALNRTILQINETLRLSASQFAARELDLKDEISQLKAQELKNIGLLREFQESFVQAQAERDQARDSFEVAQKEWLHRMDQLQASLAQAAGRETEMAETFGTLQLQSELLSDAANEMYTHFLGIQEQLVAVKTSHSWKLTRPLRALKRLASGAAAIEDNSVIRFIWPPERLRLGHASDPYPSIESGRDGATPAIEIKSLNDLLRLADIDFVFAIYRSVLRREPDEGGLAQNLERVRRGDDKRRIVFDIRTSAEGRSVNAVLPGLIATRSRMRAAASSVRNLWWKITGRAAIERAVRVLENQIGILRARQAQYSGAIDTKLEAPIIEKASNAVAVEVPAVPASSKPMIVGVGPKFGRISEKTQKINELTFFDLVMSNESGAR